MKINQIIAAGLLLASAAAAGFCGEKITVDPNAALREAQPENQAVNIYEDDPRLSQKITYRAARKLTSEITSDLERISGVDFSCGMNSKDWHSRDRKMNIFVKDAKLSDVMQSMERVMHFKWKRSGEAPNWSYRFYMTGKTWNEAEAMRTKEDDELKQKTIAIRKEIMSQFASAEKMSASEIELLKDSNPYLYYSVKTGFAPLFCALMSSPDFSSAFYSPDLTTISDLRLSPQARQLLNDYYVSEMKLQDKLFESSVPDYEPSDAQETLPLTEAQFTFGKSNSKIESFAGSFEIRYRSPNRASSSSFIFHDPSSENAKQLAKLAMFEIRVMDGMSAQEALKLSEDEYKKSHHESKKEPLKNPGYPDLIAKIIKIVDVEPRYAKMAEALHEKSGFDIITDDLYIDSDSGDSVLNREKNMQSLIHRFATAYRQDWTKSGRTLELSNPLWQRELGLLIPEAQIEKWRSEYLKTETLDIQSLTEMSKLSNGQLQYYLINDDILVDYSRLSYFLGRNKNLLEFYSSLSQSQLDEMYGDGLRLRQLPANQWKLAECFFTNRKATARNFWEILDNEDNCLTLKCKRKQSEKQYNYEFTITTTGQIDPIKLDITTPAYSTTRDTATMVWTPGI